MDKAIKQIVIVGGSSAGWLTAGVIPHGYHKTDLVIPWQIKCADISFADAVCFQIHLCEQGLAPKQITTP
jgi:hypothetical protein